MNTENQQKLLAHLKALADLDQKFAFNMSYWAAEIDGGPNECGTCACIAGHAMMLAQPHLDPKDTHDRYKIMDEAKYVAASWLGIDDDLAELLFMPNAYMFMSLNDIKIEDAIRALELIEKPEAMHAHWLEVATDQFSRGLLAKDPQQDLRQWGDPERVFGGD